MEVINFEQMKSEEPARNFDNANIDENYNVAMQNGAGYYGASKFFTAVQKAINWISNIAGNKNFTGNVSINNKSVATTEAVNNALANYIKTKTFVANNSAVLKFETDNFLFFNIIGSQNARNAIDSFAFLNVATGNFSFINRGLPLSGNWNAETKELTISGLGEWAYCQVYGKGLIFD